MEIRFPRICSISASGNLEHRSFTDMVRTAFESIPRGNGLPERITPRGRSHVALHKRDLEQVHICVGTSGISITDPRRYAFSLMNTILGGSFSSRINCVRCLPSKYSEMASSALVACARLVMAESLDKWANLVRS